MIRIRRHRYRAWSTNNKSAYMCIIWGIVHVVTFYGIITIATGVLANKSCVSNNVQFLHSSSGRYLV